MKALKSRKFIVLLFLILSPQLSAQYQSNSTLLIPGYLCGNGSSRSSCFHNPDSWLQPNPYGATIGKGLLQYQVPYISPYVRNPYYQHPVYGQRDYLPMFRNAWWYWPRSGGGKGKGIFAGGGKRSSSTLYSGSSSRSSSGSTSTSRARSGAKVGSVGQVEKKQEPPKVEEKAPEAKEVSPVVTPPVKPNLPAPVVSVPEVKEVQCPMGYDVSSGRCEANCRFDEAKMKEDENWMLSCRPRNEDCNRLERMLDQWDGVIECKPQTEGNVVADCNGDSCKKEEVIVETPKVISEILKEIPLSDNQCTGKENVDKKIHASLSQKLDPVKDSKTYQMAVCVAASYKRGLSKNSLRSCEGGKMSKGGKEICATNAYLTAVARSIEETSRCLGVDSKELFTIMNHESAMHVNSGEALGSYGLGQNNFNSAAKDLFVQQKNQLGKLLAKEDLNQASCNFVKASLKSAEVNFKAGESRFQCSLVDPGTGIQESSVMTAAYYKLLSSYYFERKLADKAASSDKNWEKEGKCPFDSLMRDSEMKESARRAVSYISYNTGPGAANIILCDYMRHSVRNGNKISPDMFSNANRSGSFARYMNEVNAVFKRSDLKQVKEFGSRIRANEKFFTVSPSGDRVAFMYMDKLVSDLNKINQSVADIEKTEPSLKGLSCGVNAYTGAK